MKAYLLQSYRGLWIPFKVVLFKQEAEKWVSEDPRIQDWSSVEALGSDRTRQFTEIEVGSIDEQFCGRLKILCDQTEEAYTKNRELLSSMQYLETRLREDLARCITVWREVRDNPADEKAHMAAYYIDAYQSTYKNMFGELLP